MSWNQQESLDRIQSRWDARDTEISVTKLTRLMNLENVTLREGRLIQGAHVYASVAGTGGLHMLDSDDHARSAIQRLAIWQTEVSKIAKAFDVPIIAFQGGRVHLLVYRPIDDNAAIARKALLLCKAITTMTTAAFNPLFDDSECLDAKAAADLGQTVGTRGGVRGDSELLFLGNAANRPAKLLGSAQLTVTTRLEDAIGDDLDYETDETSDADGLSVRLRRAEFGAALEHDGILWTLTESSGRVADELEKWPRERFKVSGATTLIDPNALSRSGSKLVTAAVILSDIDGFSSYIEKAENDEVKRDAILTLDAIRQELRDVLKIDHNGVRVQYQGDNMIGFVHLPNGDEERIVEAATDIAAAMQSSVGVTLPQVVPHASELHVSVGVAMRRTVVACLGHHAKRNGLVLGPAATEAERIQMRLPGKQTGIDKATHDALGKDAKDLYVWSPTAKCWVAEDLVVAKLARVRESLSAQQERTLTPDGAGRLVIGAAVGESTHHVRPLRPYAP
jgi:class 3 adenylate cyclase